MIEKFIDKRFHAATRQTIETVKSILREYAAQGYDLTVRQLYYQLVARGYIENSTRSYKQLCGAVNDGRMAGLIDWDMITDRGRETITPTHWTDPADIVQSAARSFAINKWRDQDNHIEVMVEKQALEGVLIPVCRRLDISFAANKGYSSSSALYETAQRLRQAVDAGKTAWILYLGDHDPSGIDMTRDVRDRVQLFAGVQVNVERLALNRDQVDELNPPENPAKKKDSRYHGYAAEHGQASWELDAIEPRRLAQIVAEAVEALRDPARWSEALRQEDEMRATIVALAEQLDPGLDQDPVEGEQ